MHAKYEFKELFHFSQELLIASELPPDRARVVAEVLLEGDLLGHDTHGLALLSPYLTALENGTMEKRGEPEILQDHGPALTLDGCYLPGPWLVRESIRLAQARLSDYPVVTVVARRSHHVGCLQAYLRGATEAGHLILLSCSDPSSRAVAPYGSMAPRLATNPLAAGIPTQGEPILLDLSMSTTSVATSKRWINEGRQAPGAWFIDRNGHGTSDPQVTQADGGGAILPLGGLDLGYKGFALSLLVEALTNCLSGHGRTEPDGRWGASYFLQLINPQAFGGLGPFLRETTFLGEYCRAAPVAKDRPGVRLPGEAAQRRRAQALANGVELYPSIMPSLILWATKFGLKLPLPNGLGGRISVCAQMSGWLRAGVK